MCYFLRSYANKWKIHTYTHKKVWNKIFWGCWLLILDFQHIINTPRKLETKIHGINQCRNSNERELALLIPFLLILTNFLFIFIKLIGEQNDTPKWTYFVVQAYPFICLHKSVLIPYALTLDILTLYLFKYPFWVIVCKERNIK